MLYIASERRLQRGYFLLIAAAPFIYAMIIPLVFLDLAASIYQAICFRAYGITRIERKKYVRLIWRGGPVVHPFDRLNCMYCSYANGMIAYARAILIETEKYWCPIKYMARQGFVPPHPQEDYANPGDEEGLRKIVTQAKG